MYQNVATSVYGHKRTNMTKLSGGKKNKGKLKNKYIRNFLTRVFQQFSFIKLTIKSEKKKPLSLIFPLSFLFSISHLTVFKENARHKRNQNPDMIWIFRSRNQFIWAYIENQK